MRKRTYRIKIKDGYFVDDVYESPVDEYQLRFRRRILWLLAAAIAIVVAWYAFSRWPH